jgi:hypothetical protein
MSSKININGHDLSKTQISATEYRVSVFRNDKSEFQFNVSLQPTGKDDVLPTYQLTDKSQTIPEWTMKNLNIISDWITKEVK